MHPAKDWRGYRPFARRNREGDEMNWTKLMIVFALPILLVIPSAADSSTVSRSFSRAAVNGGENVTVSLAVSITGGETFYAIDESYPAGWTVVSSEGDTNQSDHVKFVVIEYAADTTHRYTVRAPLAGGAYVFSGIYMFENMTSEAAVAGQSQVSVNGSAAYGIRIRITGDGIGNRIANVTWRIFSPSTQALLKELNFTTNSTGDYVAMLDDVSGVVNMKVIARGYLTRASNSVNVSGNPAIAFRLLAGDINSDNRIDVLDFDDVRPKWHVQDAIADFNRDGKFNALDFSFMSRNWGLSGD